MKACQDCKALQINSNGWKCFLGYRIEDCEGIPFGSETCPKPKTPRTMYEILNQMRFNHAQVEDVE